MKYSLVLCAVLFCSSISAQFGASIGYTTKEFFDFDVYYYFDDNRIYLGGSFWSDGAKRKEEVTDTREANYGLTRLDEGEFLNTFDFGYGRVLFDRLTLSAMVNVGARKKFVNYEDNRFSDNGYSLVGSSETKGGVGVAAGLLLAEHFEVYVGANTLKGIRLGVRAQL